MKAQLNCGEAYNGQVPFICKEAEICANADATGLFIQKDSLLFFKS
jgi:hypothetical protein